MYWMNFMIRGWWDCKRIHTRIQMCRHTIALWTLLNVHRTLMHAYVYLIFCLNRNRLQCNGRRSFYRCHHHQRWRWENKSFSIFNVFILKYTLSLSMLNNRKDFSIATITFVESWMEPRRRLIHSSAFGFIALFLIALRIS